jgi:uncharacterized protein YceH (UPF0502 family)
MGRVHPFDSRVKRHTLHLGDSDVRLADADVAQLHDTLVRLHAFPSADVQRLRARLRRMLDEANDAETELELDEGAARQVQLAVYADQVARRPVSPALADARVQAFRYLESRDAAT